MLEFRVIISGCCMHDSLIKLEILELRLSSIGIVGGRDFIKM